MYSHLRAWAVLLALAAALAVSSPKARGDDKFPRELVDFVRYANNPVFTAAGPGHWDLRIRERGWILHAENAYRMWYTEKP